MNYYRRAEYSARARWKITACEMSTNLQLQARSHRIWLNAATGLCSKTRSEITNASNVLRFAHRPQLNVPAAGKHLDIQKTAFSPCCQTKWRRWLGLTFGPAAVLSRFPSARRCLQHGQKQRQQRLHARAEARCGRRVATGRLLFAGRNVTRRQRDGASARAFYYEAARVRRSRTLAVRSILKSQLRQTNAS